MTPQTDPLVSRFHPCAHEHVSGRRCKVRIPKGSRWCENHVKKECTDCNSMRTAFIPPKGW